MEVTTKNDYYRAKLAGTDCLLAYESAAEYLGLSNGNLDMSIQVISKQPLDIEGIQYTLLTQWDSIKYANIRGLVCTTVQQTIDDLLCKDGDQQALLEALASYYYSHEESFESLILSPEARRRLIEVAPEAIAYYDEE